MSTFFSDTRKWLRTVRAVYALLRSWRRETGNTSTTADAASSGVLRKVLIMPCDPWTLNGSRGDEAMIGALVARVRCENPGTTISVITATPEASRSAEQLECKALQLWQDPWSISSIASSIAAADLVLVLGADVMDGYYSPITAMRLWIVADLAARQGKRSIVTGCSFNKRASRHLKKLLDSLDPRVEINLRDPISLARFQSFTHAKAKLVADAAFLLTPDDDSAAVTSVRQWVEGQRLKKRIVLGFNIHPMLIKGSTDGQIGTLVTQAQSALLQLLQDEPVSVLLISHDYRGRDGDATCLAPIFEHLRSFFSDRVAFPVAQMSAAELKAVAGLTDAVVTGRMHLAIAAFGQGRPVGALTYQDKFHGLFQHFDQPDWLLLDPARLHEEKCLLDMMKRLLLEQRLLADNVQLKLPKVIELSELNL